MNTLAKADQYDDNVVIPALKKQAQLDMFGGFENVIALEPSMPGVYFNAPDIDLDYDVAVVCMSGGKDSFAALKVLLDKGFPKDRIEMWHHLVDGDTFEADFMDWPFIDSYCEALSKELGIPLYRSFLKKGFRGEMLKNNSVPHGHVIETPAGRVELGRDSAKPGTRMRFPQVAASLTTRWCSSALKIEPGRRALTSQDRFIGKRVLFITGERREESSNRARYNQLEPHVGDTMRKSKNPKKPRHVDAWKAVLHLDEQQVWQILADWNLLAPVPYRLGWGRSSCQTCIFNHDKLWSTIGHYWPERLQVIAEYEQQFETTISRKGLTVLERAKLHKPLDIKDEEALKQACEKEYSLPLFVPKDKQWELPAGAFASEVSGAS